MNREKAKKAAQEVAWRDSRGFARAFEKWLGGSRNAGAAGAVLLPMLNSKEKKWLRASYQKAEKGETRIFFKTLICAMCILGTGESACRNLAKILKKMASDEAMLGELYDYLVQYGDEKLEPEGVRLSVVVSQMQRESGIEDEYYSWFSEEFGVPPEEKWPEYPSFFSTRRPGEFGKLRKEVDWEVLSGLLESREGLRMGNAPLGKIRRYLRDGGIAKLSFESPERAARIANVLFEFGLEDISLASSRITLGLKETIYEARKRAGRVAPAAVGGEDFLDDYISYFRAHGLDTAHLEEIGHLFSLGKENEAVEKMCRTMLQNCKKEYLIMGEKKYAHGEEGRRMITYFKNQVGEDGDASLLLLYDMITRGDYPSALKRLKTICDAIDDVKGEYPHIFPP